MRDKVQFMAALIHKASSHFVPFDHIRYSHRNECEREKIYQILSPITSQWEPVGISDLCEAAGCLSEAMCEKIDHYIDTKKILEYARDLRPLNEDLRPISPEEKQMFNVRIGLVNPCFPHESMRYSTIGAFRGRK